MGYPAFPALTPLSQIVALLKILSIQSRTPDTLAKPVFPPHLFFIIWPPNEPGFGLDSPCPVADVITPMRIC